MILNGTQSEYVKAVRRGKISVGQIESDLFAVDDEAYEKASFRALLFALDAINVLNGERWLGIFVEGLTDHSGWLAGGWLLEPQAFNEIGKYHEVFGRGEYSMELVIDLISKARKKPPNSASFARRCIREHFNGVQPVTNHALFALKKYFGDGPTDLDDLRVLLHIEEETKGLDNTVEFDHFFARTITRAAKPECEHDGRAERLVTEFLAESDEITEAERLAIRTLRSAGLQVSEKLLGHIDLGREKLLGLA